MLRVKKILFLLFIGLSFSFISCSENKKSDTAGKEKIIFLGNGAEPQDLDPQIVTAVPEQRIVAALFEGLVRENPKNLQPMPGVAESWQISEDGLTYTFHLRNNAKWSNGDLVTANDFVESYKRILSPNLASQNAYMLYLMKNAERYNKGEITDFSKVGVKALDYYTLQITLEKPAPYFLSLLSHQAWYPVNCKVIAKYGSVDQRGSQWTLPGNLVGNGPFILTKWEINKVIEVRKNPYYWNADSVKLNGANFYPISDGQTEERAFRTGQLHVTYTVPTSKIEVYQKENPELIKITPYLGTFYLVFNVEKFPFNNSEIRKAFMYATDKKAIAFNVVKGGRLPADSFTPPNTGGYTAGTEIDYNPAKAKEIMAKDGFQDGKNFPTIQLIYNSSDRNRRIGEAIQEMWKKNLNVNVELINKEWKVYLDTFRTRDFDAALASWIGDYNDPNTFLDMWVSDGSNNRAKWSDDNYTTLIGKAEKSNNVKERLKYFLEAENILIGQAPIIPLFYYTSLALVKPEVKGWYQNILDHHPLNEVDLKR